MPSTHAKFMEKALLEAKYALKNGEFPVGCVMVHKDTVIASGRRQCSGATPAIPANELDHAEVLALRELITRHPHVDLREVTVYATLEPCLMCHSTLLISGIRTIVYAYEDALGGGTTVDLAGLPPLYQAMAVSVVPHVLREQSLALFKQFFGSKDNTYLSGTLLAEYTMRQP